MSGLRIIVKLFGAETQPERAVVLFEDYTHMDTYTVLKGCYTKHYLDRCCIVEPFLDSYDGQKLPIVNEFYCYDDQYGQS